MLYEDLREDMDGKRKHQRVMEVVDAVRLAGSLPKPGDSLYNRWNNLFFAARNSPTVGCHAELLSLYEDLREDKTKKGEVVHSVGWSVSSRPEKRAGSVTSVVTPLKRRRTCGAADVECSSAEKSQPVIPREVCVGLTGG